MGEDDESVVIEEAAAKLDIFQQRFAGLDVTVEVVGEDLVVHGEDLHSCLILLEPDVWDPNRSRGDA